MVISRRDSRTPRTPPALWMGLRAAAGILMLQVLAGCASNPTAAELMNTPLHARHALDARAQFRESFCRHYALQGGDTPACGYWLWRLPDEPTAAAVEWRSEPGNPSAVERRYRTLIIPGAFGECFGEDADPFGEALPVLRSKGRVIDIVPVEGRSGTRRNAQLIAAWIDAHGAAGENLVLIGYSKGSADILQFLVDFPAQAQQVKAVVSIAGAVSGTPLADSNAALFDLTGARLPNAHCARGDRGVLDSLRRDVRTAWLKQHPLPANIRYFSVAAFTTHDRVAHALLPTWRILLRKDVHTDGQLLTGDSVIAGSTLLGYVNADHWELALGIERRFGFLAGRAEKHAFPRGVLLEAVLDAADSAFDPAHRAAGAQLINRTLPIPAPRRE